MALAGFMAVGKSTVGRVLGSLLHWNFFDLDCEIESRESLRVREIFEKHGERRFRELEAAALRTLVERPSGPTVIALGGGTFVERCNAELLRSCGARTVFLELDLEQLLHRCLAAAERCEENPRPLAANREAFYALYAQRLPSYRGADLIVHTAGKAVEQVAREISERLHLRELAG